MTSHLPVAIVLPLLVLAASCSSGGTATPTSPPAPAAAPTTAPPATTVAPTTAPAAAPASTGPGTITLDVSGVTGARDLILLGLVPPAVPGQAMGAVCQPVGADPFSYAGPLLPVTGDHPCALGTEPLRFEPGTYTMVVAAIRGGEQTPQQCTEVAVTVAGDVTVEVTELGPPTDCSL